MSADLDRWRSLGRDVRVLGHRLFVVDLARGPGRPLLLIHGFPTCGFDWARVADALAAGRRLVVPDLLGYGLSDKPRAPYTIALQADLLLALLGELGVQELDLVSHDMGDTVACELLARRRAGGGGPRLRRVAMLNGGLIPELHRPVLTQRLLRSRLAPLVTRLMTRRSFGRAFSRVFARATRPTPAELDDHWALVTRDGGLANYPSLIGYLAEREQHRARWVGALVALELPLRLVWGDQDPVATWAIAEEVRRLRPATDVVRLEGVGHYPQLEAPARVARALLEHLGQSKSGS
jgi:pimeloyl-ACP methyl ester carboxylesterase